MILDACVVIDYAESDLSVLGTVSRNVAPIALARPILDEVEQLDEHQAVALGVTIVDVDLSLATSAAAPGSTLSFEDRVCLLLAKREAWTCVTNDKPLRAACAKEAVTVMWGLEMMLHAVGAGAMTSAEAIDVAKAMHDANPRYVTKQLVAEFTRKVRRSRSR